MQQSGYGAGVAIKQLPPLIITVNEGTGHFVAD